jgi:DNA-binding NtrC family response regulator
MTSPAKPDRATVAVFNTNDDVVELLRMALERSGFVVVSGHIDDARRGSLLLSAFVEEHNPAVILYDVAPPYERHWAFLEHVRSQPFMANRQFVITSTNVQRVREQVGIQEPIFEIVGKTEDIEPIVNAVKTASRARSLR